MKGRSSQFGLTNCGMPNGYEETHVGYVAADDDLVRIVERAPVDVHREASRGETVQRCAKASQEFVVGSARTDGLTHGQRE